MNLKITTEAKYIFVTVTSTCKIFIFSHFWVQKMLVLTLPTNVETCSKEVLKVDITFDTSDMP